MLTALLLLAELVLMIRAHDRRLVDVIKHVQNGASRRHAARTLIDRSGEDAFQSAEIGNLGSHIIKMGRGQCFDCGAGRLARLHQGEKCLDIFDPKAELTCSSDE